MCNTNTLSCQNKVSFGPVCYNEKLQSMSGIIGYIGNKRVVPVLLEGLQRLQYRGYESAGLAVMRDGALDVRRATGKLRNLEEAIRQNPLDGAYGIGHTRWATHGAPTEENAHPHRDCRGTVVVVHNGIIENYLELKRSLEAEGHKFTTETDTEVIAHLVEKHLDGNPELRNPKFEIQNSKLATRSSASAAIAQTAAAPKGLPESAARSASTV